MNKEYKKGGIVKLFKSQRGITGLETAIILIAFVVVSAVSIHTYIALKAGVFSEGENFVITNESLGVGDGAKTRFALNYPLGTVDVSNLNVFLDSVKTDMSYSLSKNGIIVFKVAPKERVKITVNYAGRRIKKE